MLKNSDMGEVEGLNKHLISTNFISHYLLYQNTSKYQTCLWKSHKSRGFAVTVQVNITAQCFCNKRNSGFSSQRFPVLLAVWTGGHIKSLQLPTGSSQAVAAAQPTWPCPHPARGTAGDWSAANKAPDKATPGPAVPQEPRWPWQQCCAWALPLLHCKQECGRNCGSAVHQSPWEYTATIPTAQETPSPLPITHTSWILVVFFSTASTNASTTQVPAFRKLIISPPKYLYNTWGKKMVRKQRSSFLQAHFEDNYQSQTRWLNTRSYLKSFKTLLLNFLNYSKLWLV